MFLHENEYQYDWEKIYQCPLKDRQLPHIHIGVYFRQMQPPDENFSEGPFFSQTEHDLHGCK